VAVKIKFCGLKRPEEVRAAGKVGAGYVGFVHFAKSPRHLTTEDIAALAADTPAGVASVALVVDPDDSVLGELAGAIDWFQLHGKETPDRVADIRTRFGRPVMKAVGISNAEDLASIDTYAAVADQILVDAKPGEALPGGNGVAFDWRLISGRQWTSPWMLAGGLTAANVATAVRLTRAMQVDVSSGIESAPGVKDVDAMAAFAGALSTL